MTAQMQIQDRSISSGGRSDRYNKLAGAANAAAGAGSLRADSGPNYYSMAVLSWKYSTRASAPDNDDDDDDAQVPQEDVNSNAHEDDEEDDEFLEEDVWASVPSLVMVKENHNVTDQNTKGTANNHAGNTIGFMMRQAAGEGNQDQDQPFASEPIRVPARPKLKKLTSSTSCCYDYDDDEGDHDDDYGGGGCMNPPHLIAARAFARKEVGLWSSSSFASSTSSSSASVVEGAGRTLKGRDQRNLRDAVWRSTGFLD